MNAWRCVLAAAVLAIPGSVAKAACCPATKNEQIVFFPTFANLTPDHRAWEVSIHGWIFEPAIDFRLRRYLLKALTPKRNIP